MSSKVFLGGKLRTLRETIGLTRSAVYMRLIEQCERYFTSELPEDHPAASTTYMGIAMANLALAYLLSDNDRYLLEAKRWIFACVGYPHWGNAHLVDVDLSAAWILFGMSIAYDWLEAVLTGEETAAIREKLILQGTRMYEFKVSTEGSGWSTNYWQNHNWINLTGLATAGYALQETCATANDWVNCAKENFAFVYSVLPEDGSDYEGVVYWRYGVMWLFVYAHLVKEREGIDYFRTCRFLENTFTYRLYQAAPNLLEQINFGDTHDRHSGHSTAIYYKVAAEYQNGYAQKMGNLVRDVFLKVEARESAVKPGILPECFFEVLFFDPEVEERDFNDLPLTVFFEDLGLFVRRSSWERDATLFAIKCSRPGGKTQWDWLWRLKREKNYNCFGLSHQHPDNNSFLIHSQGEFFAIDDGYNREVRAADHNVVLVDGKGYDGDGRNNVWKDFDVDMFGEIETCIIDDGLSYVVGETARTYWKDLKLKTFRRHLVSTGRPWYVMFDELESEYEHIYTWQMFSDVYPVDCERSFRYEIGSATLALHHFSSVPTSHEFTERTIRSIMTTQEPDKFTENEMKGLCISNMEPVASMTFSSVFVPGVEEEVEVAKVECEGACGVTVFSADSSEVFLFSQRRHGTFLDIKLNTFLTIIEMQGDIVNAVRKVEGEDLRYA